MDNCGNSGANTCTKPQTSVRPHSGPHSGVEEVKTARIHLALEPGYLNNLDAGIKHNFNAKINQHFAE